MLSKVLVSYPSDLTLWNLKIRFGCFQLAPVCVSELHALPSVFLGFMTFRIPRMASTPKLDTATH